MLISSAEMGTAHYFTSLRFQLLQWRKRRATGTGSLVARRVETLSTGTTAASRAVVSFVCQSDDDDDVLCN